MQILDQSLQLKIDEILIARNKEREALHEPSGKLSASWLFQPTRFQIMKTIGVPTRDVEPYVLGKFLRGDQAEDWLIEQMDKMGILKAKQKEVEYRSTVGRIDSVVDSNELFCKKGIIPLEIKSVTNAKLARIAKTSEIDWHYKLQAGLYGLAEGSDYYGIGIISAEDLRTNLYIFPTKEIKHEIDTIITKYDDAMKYWKVSGELPKLEVDDRVKWAINPQYARFEEKYLNMSDEQLLVYKR